MREEAAKYPPSLSHTFKSGMIIPGILLMCGTGSGCRRHTRVRVVMDFRVKPRPCIISISRLEAMGMVLPVTNEKTLPREQRYLLLRSFKCYSEITQCKHAWGCPVSTGGASWQWQQDCVDMPELASKSREHTKPTKEAGYIRLPYSMNCYGYTRNGKRHTSWMQAPKPIVL